MVAMIVLSTTHDWGRRASVESINYMVWVKVGGIIKAQKH